MSKYTVKNVKTFIGMEGQGFNATLYRDGKKVAFVIDDACGGCYNYDFVNPQEEKDYFAFCKAQPSIEFQGTILTMDGDIFISELVSQHQQDKKLRSLCKTKTVVLMKDDHAGSFTVFAVKFTDEFKAVVEKKYGEQVVEFVNQRYV